MKPKGTAQKEEHEQFRPDLEKLKAYSEAKLDLADRLRVMRETLKSLGHDKSEQQCSELMVKLAEDRFTLAVLGQFNRGKSSLMNAIIGKEILPTGILPLTSAITILAYGPKERLVVERNNSAFPEEFATEALPDLVTEKGNPGNQKKIKSVRIEFPNSFLRRGVQFVDTPGIGSSIHANTVTTCNFLPECDAVLFVTSTETPLTSTEMQFIRDVREYVNKMFFIINKSDLLDEGDIRQVFEYVSGAIQKEPGINNDRIYTVSAKLGIQAIQEGHKDLYLQSGIKSLEEALSAFIVEEKSRVFLAAIAQKAARILDESEIFGDVREELERTFNPDQPVREQRPEGFPAEVGYLMTERKPEHRENPETKFQNPDFSQDLRTKGCPVCKYMTDHATNLLIHWQYEIATDQGARNVFASEHGFCPLHTWQLMAVTSPQGASLGFPVLADQLALELLTKGHENRERMWIANLVPDHGSCRICESLRTAEKNYLNALAEYIGDERGLQDYLNSQGVCLRHLGRLAELVPFADTVERLTRHAAEYLQGNSEDMRNYSLKRDALRRSLLNASEEDAYMRAIVHIFGDRMVCMPWPKDRYI